MNADLGISLFLVAGCLIRGQAAQGFGAYQPTDQTDMADVEYGLSMILSYTEARAPVYNGYTTYISLNNVRTQKQVVAGTNYRYTYTTLYKFECIKSNAICTSKNPITQSCSAVIWKKLDGTYVFNQTPTCSG